MRTLVAKISRADEARGFIEYALHLARDLEARVRLLYMENPSHYPLGTPDLTGAAVAQLRQTLEERIKMARQTLTGEVGAVKDESLDKVTVEIFTEIGSELTTIQEMVESGEADMVMLQGDGMESFWLKDSFARDIVRRVDCPVWIIPDGAVYHPFGHIIYATDYREEDISTLRDLTGLTRSFNPQITALHITDQEDFDERVKSTGFQKMLESKTEYDRISVKVLIEKEGDDMVDMIDHYASEHSADMIVVLKENKNFLERIFSGSDSEKIIKGVHVPVLVYHAHRNDKR